MPNHCYNVLTIGGDESDVTLCLDYIHGEREDDFFSCDKVIPYPKEYADKDKNGSGHSDGFNSGGYEWCIANWGTKWGAYDSNLIERETGFAKIDFNSAWSPPVPVVEKLAELFPMLAIRLEFEEIGADYSGFMTWENGSVTCGQGDYDDFPITDHSDIDSCRSG